MKRNILPASFPHRRAGVAASSCPCYVIAWEHRAKPFTPTCKHQKAGHGNKSGHSSAKLIINLQYAGCLTIFFRLILLDGSP